jgi:hypothetical protein
MLLDKSPTVDVIGAVAADASGAVLAAIVGTEAITVSEVARTVEVTLGTTEDAACTTGAGAVEVRVAAEVGPPVGATALVTGAKALVTGAVIPVSGPPVDRVAAEAFPWKAMSRKKTAIALNTPRRAQRKIQPVSKAILVAMPNVRGEYASQMAGAGSSPKLRT